MDELARGRDGRAAPSASDELGAVEKTRFPAADEVGNAAVDGFGVPLPVLGAEAAESRGSRGVGQLLEDLAADARQKVSQ